MGPRVREMLNEAVALQTKIPDLGAPSSREEMLLMFARYLAVNEAAKAVETELGKWNLKTTEKAAMGRDSHTVFQSIARVLYHHSDRLGRKLLKRASVMEASF